EQEAANPRRLGIEPVGHPARVLPAEPYGEPENERLDQPCEAQVMQERVTDPSDGKHIDQIEEQLLEGHARMMSVAMTQQRMGSGCFGIPAHDASCYLARRYRVWRRIAGTVGTVRKSGVFSNCIACPIDGDPHADGCSWDVRLIPARNGKSVTIRELYR